MKRIEHMKKQPTGNDMNYLQLSITTYTDNCSLFDREDFI